MPAKPLRRLAKGQPLTEQLTAEWGNALIDAIEERTPLEGAGTRLRRGAGGFSYSGGAGGISAGFTPAFKVTYSADDLVARVRWGIVTGLNASGYVPMIAEVALDADEQPTIEADPGETIYLRVEIEPNIVEDVDAYVLSDTDYTVVNDRVSVTTSTPNKGFPAWNTANGEITRNGIYYTPIAKITTEGAVKQLSIGPQAWQFCSTGMLQVSAPVIIHTGTLEELG